FDDFYWTAQRGDRSDTRSNIAPLTNLPDHKSALTHAPHRCNRRDGSLTPPDLVGKHRCPPNRHHVRGLARQADGGPRGMLQMRAVGSVSPAPPSSTAVD